MLLNFNETFDLASARPSARYAPVDPAAREAYITAVASQEPYPYQAKEMPTCDEIMTMFSSAASRMAAKRAEMRCSEPMDLLFDLPGGKFARVALDHDKAELLDDFEARDRYMRVKVDPRLLAQVLQGPRFANWNNIEIGAHLELDRRPDVYTPSAHVLMNSLHV